MTTSKVLLIYSTTDGRTFEIISRIAKQLAPIKYDLLNIKEVNQINLQDYTAVLIGASIRYGYFNKLIFKFIEENMTTLNAMKSAYFGVCVTARKPNKNTPETNRYTTKFFNKIAWQPNLKGVFAGALFYPKYNFFDRTMIRFIMWLGGEKNHDMSKEYSYTDWDKVDEFAQQFIQLVTK